MISRVIWRVEFSGLGHQLWEVEEEKRYCSLFLQYKFIYFNWRRDIIVLMEKTHRVTHKVEFDRNCKAFPGLPLGKWKVQSTLSSRNAMTIHRIPGWLSELSRGWSNGDDCGHAHPLPAFFPVRIFQRLMPIWCISFIFQHSPIHKVKNESSKVLVSQS